MTTPVTARPSYMIVTLPIPVTTPDGRMITAQIQFNECSMCKALLSISAPTSDHTYYHQDMMLEIDNKVRLEVQSALSALRQQQQTAPVQEPAESTPAPVKKKRPKHLGKKVDTDTSKGRCSRCFTLADKFYDRVVDGKTVYEGLCKDCHVQDMSRDAATTHHCEMCGDEVEHKDVYQIFDGPNLVHGVVCKGCYYEYPDSLSKCAGCQRVTDPDVMRNLGGQALCHDCYDQKLGRANITINADLTGVSIVSKPQPGVGLFQQRSHQDWGWDNDTHKRDR